MKSKHVLKAVCILIALFVLAGCGQQLTSIPNPTPPGLNLEPTPSIAIATISPTATPIPTATLTPTATEIPLPTEWQGKVDHVELVKNADGTSQWVAFAKPGKEGDLPVALLNWNKAKNEWTEIEHAQALPTWLNEYDWMKKDFKLVKEGDTYYLQADGHNYFEYGTFPDGTNQVTEWQPTITFGTPETPEKIVNLIPPIDQPELRQRFLARLYEEGLKHQEWFYDLPEGFKSTASAGGDKLNIVGNQLNALGDFYDFGGMVFNKIEFIANDFISNHKGVVIATPITLRNDEKNLKQLWLGEIDVFGEDWSWENAYPELIKPDIVSHNLQALQKLKVSPEIFQVYVRLNNGNIAPHFPVFKEMIDDLDRRIANWRDIVDYGFIHFGEDSTKDKQFTDFIRENLIPISMCVVRPK